MTNETDRIECAIRHIKTAVDVDPWAVEIAVEAMEKMLKDSPPVQPEIIRCKDCEYGERDEVGRWFCRGLGCQIGNEDGSGYCADAERRTDDKR